MTVPFDPKDWSFDSGDASVGIFGSEWTHETCPWWNDVQYGKGSEPTVTEELTGERHQGEGMQRMVIRTFKLTCSCGASTTVDDSDWDPDGPEDCEGYEDPIYAAELARDEMENPL